MNANSTSNTALCGPRGGLWPTVEAYLGFLVTNIVAHAATIHLPQGLDTPSNVQAVLASIFMPVFAGDRAFQSINRWLSRLFKGKMRLNDLFVGGTFEDAAVSGVLAISIPLRFAPIVAERWEKAARHQKIIMLNNKNYWPPKSAPHPELPFKVRGKSQQYVPYILPPTTRFPGYTNYTLSPTSSWLPQTIGIVQAILSSRQLYLNYSSSIVADGLSSPYVVVIPYIFMSIVNMVANALVNSYTQVTMLPMNHVPLPSDNDAFISGPDKSTPEKYRLRVFGLQGTPLTPTTSSAGDVPKVTRPGIQTAPHISNDSEMEEFTGLDWVPFSPSRTPVAGPFVEDVEVLNLGILHIHRTESWTSVCYDLNWRLVWGLKQTPPPTKAPTNQTPEAQKERTAFLRQRFIWQFSWRLMKHNATGEYGQNQLNEFNLWLKDNYPGIEVPLDNLPRRFSWSSLFGGLFLQALVTAIVGGLTRFKVGNASHAAWLLFWLYGSAALRWMWLISEMIYKYPSLSVWKWMLFWFTVFMEFLVAVGICCSITVLLVELFEALCGMNFVISPGVWILVMVLITTAFAIATCIVIFLGQILDFISSVISKLSAGNTATNQQAGSVPVTPGTV